MAEVQGGFGRVLLEYLEIHCGEVVGVVCHRRWDLFESMKSQYHSYCSRQDTLAKRYTIFPTRLPSLHTVTGVQFSEGSSTERRPSPFVAGVDGGSVCWRVGRGLVLR